MLIKATEEPKLMAIRIALTNMHVNIIFILGGLKVPLPHIHIKRALKQLFTTGINGLTGLPGATVRFHHQAQGKFRQENFADTGQNKKKNKDNTEETKCHRDV